MSRPEDLVVDLVRAVVNDPELASESWDTYALIGRLTPGVEQLNAFSYRGSGRPVPASEGGDSVFDLFIELQDLTADPQGERWEVAVLRIDRDSGRFAIDYHYGEDAAAWRVDPSTFQRIAEAARPRPEDFD